MEYGYVRDIEQVNDYLGARKVFIDRKILRRALLCRRSRRATKISWKCSSSSIWIEEVLFL